MDVTDLNKVANRKRMSTDVEKLREKVSRENKKIIKLKVAQDTAYWDLKEQLRQVEGNHEKLQQNMVELQMQYETVSGKYQDELRLRPETLNKLASTREICDVLEDYSERLRDTLSRCKDDHGALYDAYQRSGHLVRDMKTQQLQANEKTKLIVDSLQDKIKVASDHQAQLLQFFTSEKQRCDSELGDVRARLGEATAQRDELMAAGRELTRRVDQTRTDIEKKEEIISNLQSDIKHLIHEFNTQANEMKNTIVKQEKDLKEATNSTECLKQALTNQEAFTKTICDQNNELQEKVAILEEDQTLRVREIEGLGEKLQDALKINDDLKNDVAMLTTKKESLEKEIQNKSEILSATEQEMQLLMTNLSGLDSEKAAIVTALKKATQEAKDLVSKVHELTDDGVAMEKRIDEMQRNWEAEKEANKKRIQELQSTIDAKDVELDTKKDTISQLMTKVCVASEERTKTETALERVKKEMEGEKEAAREKERRLGEKIDKLETILRTKEDDLNKQMTVILELRSDKERLHEVISSMQNKIDNIQKEITGPVTRAPRIQPEQDDNAVMLTPGKKTVDFCPNKDNHEFAVPRGRDRDFDPKDTMFNFLSDNSLDGDNTLDPVDVKRRFDALSRGGRLSPPPLGSLGSLKRRAGVAAAHGGLRAKPVRNDVVISLSQTKEEMKQKERTFFKNKRSESRANKKPKQPVNHY